MLKFKEIEDPLDLLKQDKEDHANKEEFRPELCNPLDDVPLQLKSSFKKGAGRPGRQCEQQQQRQRHQLSSLQLFLSHPMT